MVNPFTAGKRIKELHEVIHERDMEICDLGDELDNLAGSYEQLISDKIVAVLQIRFLQEEVRQQNEEIASLQSQVLQAWKQVGKSKKGGT